MTFEFRVWPNAENPGSIDDSHKGPCAVYLKKVDDMFSEPASGPGWFKIWEDGYNADSDKWCVDKLIENNGLLSINLPTGLPSGYYLVRPELLALHQAYRGDPQFFHGCAQVFVQNGPQRSLDLPGEYEVSIPGHVEADAPGLTFNLYEDEASSYEIPGPKVYIPESLASSAKQSKKNEQDDGKMPDNCVLKNGNWCARPVPRSSDVDSCWESVDDCWAQSKECWSTMPVTGGTNCEVWADYCESLGDQCDAGNYDGPAAFDGEEQYAPVPGDIPKPYHSFQGTTVNIGEDAGGTDKEPTEPTSTAETSSPSTDPAPQETSAGSAPEELKVSEDGRCGGNTGRTCKGSAFGDCCSKKGKCGRKTRHCACGCQAEFGDCSQ